MAAHDATAKPTMLRQVSADAADSTPAFLVP